MSSRTGTRAGGWTLPWLLLLGACATAVAAMDGYLIARATGFFSTGFNGAAIGGLPLFSAFFAASLLLDLALVLGLFSLCLPLLHVLRVRALPTYVLCAGIGVGAPLLIAAARYNLYAVLGNAANVHLLLDVPDGGSIAVAGVALEQLDPVALLIVGTIAIALPLASRWVWRFERRLGGAAAAFRPPPTIGIFLALACCMGLGALVLWVPSATAARLQYGLSFKPSAFLLQEVVARATDLDGDGYGLGSRPPDPDPFDARIRPYAIDAPSNGVDENGLAGDHPGSFEPQPVATEPGFRGEARPHVLLIFLETFRFDLIGRELDGAEITPFLNRLSREGAASEHAYVHSPWTVPSRAQLFQGNVVYAPGRSTLVDDFKSRGYVVGHFSGQDESYAGSEALLGVERADVFYDARQDLDRRSSRATSKMSLQVSSKLVNRRVAEFLETADASRPTLLYVNFTDTHFPYTHAEIDPILESDTIDPGEIRADRAQHVWRTYANTAANVDRAVERLVGRFREHIGGGDHAILVTADHGQAFYEKGFLGHGQAFDATQTRVPLIVWGIGGEWPEPVGLADLRGLLRRNLAAERDGASPRARFVPDPERRVFQWVGSRARPTAVGLRGLDRLASYDFGRGRVAVVDRAEADVALTPEQERSVLQALVWSWESVQAGFSAGNP